MKGGEDERRGEGKRRRGGEEETRGEAERGRRKVSRE
jgi:hypothetical protein